MQARGRIGLFFGRGFKDYKVVNVRLEVYLANVIENNTEINKVELRNR